MRCTLLDNFPGRRNKGMCIAQESGELGKTKLTLKVSERQN